MSQHPEHQTIARLITGKNNSAALQVLQEHYGPRLKRRGNQVFIDGLRAITFFHLFSRPPLKST